VRTSQHVFSNVIDDDGERENFVGDGNLKIDDDDDDAARCELIREACKRKLEGFLREQFVIEQI
jgi:hypothetical protein|tara:strand:+ start:73 stop:264 length:192 start_codon:yes stop_codon:yes gene_type:complete